jgi:vacuolar-type H+-ATPase subunit H
MREVIQQIIATEAEAKALVEAARAEAERILAEARTASQEMIELARREARIEGERIVHEAVEVAEGEKEASLKLARAGIESQIRLNDEDYGQIVEGVVQCVCGLR